VRVQELRAQFDQVRVRFDLSTVQGRWLCLRAAAWAYLAVAMAVTVWNYETRAWIITVNIGTATISWLVAMTGRWHMYQRLSALGPYQYFEHHSVVARTERWAFGLHMLVGAVYFVAIAGGVIIYVDSIDTVDYAYPRIIITTMQVLCALVSIIVMGSYGKRINAVAPAPPAEQSAHTRVRKQHL
jgi:hypothetical protein